MLYITTHAGGDVGRVISCVCEFVCPRCKRKKARAINSKFSRRIINGRVGVGVHVDTIAYFSISTGLLFEHLKRFLVEENVLLTFENFRFERWSMTSKYINSLVIA